MQCLAKTKVDSMGSPSPYYCDKLFSSGLGADPTGISLLPAFQARSSSLANEATLDEKRTTQVVGKCGLGSRGKQAVKRNVR